MFLLKGIIHLLWHIVTFPVHLLLALIKWFVITPIVLLVTLALALFLCVAVVFPGSIPGPSISVPGIISSLSVPLQHLISPSSSPQLPAQPSQVNSNVHGGAIEVSWVAGGGNIQWYQVLRKTPQDTTWHRIALITATGNNPDSPYRYDDTELQHGTTYIYAVVAVLANGSESVVVVSPTQIVAP